MEKSKSNKCITSDYSCSQKGQMNRHVVSVHEGRKPFIGKIWNYLWNPWNEEAIFDY